eukprot:2048314-Pyramimonas_sp.AAC.1
MSCQVLTSKPYATRPSPPIKAPDCPNQTRKGNDGLMYESRLTQTKTGETYRWYKVKSAAAAAPKKKAAVPKTKTKTKKKASPPRDGAILAAVDAYLRQSNLTPFLLNETLQEITMRFGEKMHAFKRLEEEHGIFFR